MGVNALKKRLEAGFAKYLYSEEEIKAYESYIEEKFGSFQEVMHEVFSPDIHLDIIVIPPNEKQNYYKLITMGMGAYKMNVPEELGEYQLERAELVLHLPADWNLKSDKEEDYWPIRCLKSLARLPIRNDAWLGCRHTISTDEENTPYADNTGFSSVILFNALDSEFKRLSLKFESKGEINFYQLFFLYPEELDFILEYDSDDFLDLLDDNITPVLDLNRENCCGKNSLGKILDDGFNHSSKITRLNLSADMLSGYNHLAVFLRWCAEHNLLSDRLLSELPELPSVVKDKSVDLREYIKNTPLLNGKIRVGYFNDSGARFAKEFYVFNTKGSFTNSVDCFAEEYFGTEKYNCEEFQDEAYLFVPYNEEYYKGLSKYIDDAWDKFLGDIFDMFK